MGWDGGVLRETGDLRCSAPRPTGLNTHYQLLFSQTWSPHTSPPQNWTSLLGNGASVHMLFCSLTKVTGRRRTKRRGPQSWGWGVQESEWPRPTMGHGDPRSCYFYPAVINVHVSRQLAGWSLRSRECRRFAFTEMWPPGWGWLPAFGFRQSQHPLDSWGACLGGEAPCPRSDPLIAGDPRALPLPSPPNLGLSRHWDNANTS